MFTVKECNSVGIRNSSIPLGIVVKIERDFQIRFHELVSWGTDQIWSPKSMKSGTSTRSDEEILTRIIEKRFLTMRNSFDNAGNGTIFSFQNDFD